MRQNVPNFKKKRQYMPIFVRPREKAAISHDDIIACLAYARDTLSSENVFPSAARCRRSDAATS
jgi:hypothetical protein